MVDRLTCKGRNGYHWVIQTHEGEDAFEIAQVLSQWTPERDDEVSEATANLIAAAPQLLEALQVFRACAEYMTAGEPIANAQRLADTAIAKAKGA